MRRWGESIALGFGLGMAVAVLITWTRIRGTPVDAWCYYGMDPAHPYDPTRCFLYSPPIAQVMTALQPLVSFDAFFTALRVLEMIALALITGPAVGVVLLIPAVEIELNAANVNLLLVGAVLLGFRYPWTWAFVILTKLTPGVGLLWFAVRREWRSLGIALGSTAAIVAVSFVLMPHNWFAWFDLLAANTGKGGTWASIPIPLLIRGPIGVALIVWCALRNQRWTVPVGAMLALPALWYGSLSVPL